MRIHSFIKSVCLLGLISLCAGGAALAADGDQKTGQYQLGEVVVRAQHPGVESVGTVREVTAEQIEAMGARTLEQAIKLLPGLNVRIGAGGVPRVDIRGFRSRHVLLLLNGVPFNSTYDGQFDPSLIPTENIARIKVTYGTNSVLYGQGGLGGVIDIITKAGGKGLGGKVKGEAGSGDSYLGAFTVHGGDDKIDAFASGSWYQRDNWRVSDDYEPTSEQGDGARVGSDKKRGNLFANMQYRASDQWQFGFSAGANNGEYSIPPSAINNSKDEFANKPKYDKVDDILGYFGQASVSYKSQGPLSFRAWAYYNRQEDTSKRYDNNQYNSMIDPTVQTFDLDQTTDVAGVNAQAGYDLKRWGRMTLGLIAENNNWEQSGRTRDQRIGKSKDYAWRTVDDSRDLNIYSAALEYEVSIVKNLELVLGVGQNWQDRSEGDADGANYLAGLNWMVIPGTNLRGSYAHKIRFPSIRQLYDEANGNPDLEPEESDTFELGIEQDLPYNTRLSLTGYHIKVRDYIERIGDDIFRNYDKYRFQGFELTAESRPCKGLWLRGGYTYLDSKDESPGTDKDELQNRPRHKLTLQGTYTFPFGLGFYMGFQYLADTYYYSRKEPLQKAKYGDYALVDLKISQSLFNDRLSVYVGADNLFDKNYEEAYGYPAEGRFIYVGAEARF
jgi:vitamin B12 transporter